MRTGGEYVTVIKPRKTVLSVDLKELWRYRELFFFLVWRDVKVKYKQSALGILWAIIVPFLQMVVFSVIFGRLAKMPTDGVPPQIFYYAGLLIWTYFATSVSFASSSMVANKNLLTKIYFPRLIMPLAPVLAAYVDFFIALSILFAMMIYFGVSLTFALLAAPLFMILASLSAAGAGLLFSALNVKYRDIGFALPFIVQIWMYGTVIMPYSSMPPYWGKWKVLYGLNPMGGAVEGFRWSLLSGNLAKTVSLPLDMIAISVFSALALFAFGLWYFRKMEDAFADIV